jgi:hypothetical protein
MLARNWAVDDLADALQAACDQHYPPTWDRQRGEMTWDFGLGEPHPRGQYNATMAAADAMGEGAWWRLGNVATTARFDEPTVCDVDFPSVALSRADWEPETEQLHLALHPMNDAVVGRPTTMRITGLDDAGAWVGRGSDGIAVDVERRDDDLVVHTVIGRHALVIERR